MKRTRILSAVPLLLAASLLAMHSEAEKGKGKTLLEVGDAAPDFSLQGSDGRTYTLEEFRGEKAVVLAFFPKAFTPG